MSNLLTIDNLQYRLDKKYGIAVLVKVVYDLPDVKIPEQVDGCMVNEISYDVFSENTILETISFPDTIQFIGPSAFERCSNLKEVRVYATSMPAPELNIDCGAFCGCTNLRDFFFEMPMFVNCKGYAFCDCNSLQVLNCKLDHLELSAFANCVNLDNIVFTHSAKWHPSTFSGCLKLKDITFLGDINDSVSDTCIEWLKDKNIECTDSSKLVNLAYEGVNVKILPF